MPSAAGRSAAGVLKAKRLATNPERDCQCRERRRQPQRLKRSGAAVGRNAEYPFNEVHVRSPIAPVRLCLFERGALDQKKAEPIQVPHVLSALAYSL